MAVVAATEVGFAALMQPLLDGSFVERDPDLIALVPLLIVGIFVVRGLASFAANFFMAWIGRHVIFDLRREMFAHLLDLPPSFFQHHTTGQILSKFSYDVEQVADAASKAVTILVQDTLTLVGLLAWMFYLDWRLSLLFCAASAPACRTPWATSPTSPRRRWRGTRWCGCSAVRTTSVAASTR